MDFPQWVILLTKWIQPKLILVAGSKIKKKWMSLQNCQKKYNFLINGSDPNQCYCVGSISIFNLIILAMRSVKKKLEHDPCFEQTKLSTTYISMEAIDCEYS